MKSATPEMVQSGLRDGSRGFDHGVGHPSCLCARHTSAQGERGVGGLQGHAASPRGSDAVIEACHSPSPCP